LITEHLKRFPLSFVIGSVLELDQRLCLSMLEGLSKSEKKILQKGSKFQNNMPFEEFVVLEFHQNLSYFHMNDVGNFIFSVIYKNLVESSINLSEVRVRTYVASVSNNDFKSSEMYIKLYKKLSTEKQLNSLEEIKKESLEFLGNTPNPKDYSDVMEGIENLKTSKDIVTLLDLIFESQFDDYHNLEFWKLFYLEYDSNHHPLFENIRNDIYSELLDEEESNDMAVM
jgi:hypothetical protein